MSPVPQPLVITAACGLARPPGAEPRPDTPSEVAASVYEAYEAGASIAQIRAPSEADPVTGRPRTDLGTWVELAERIRGSCDIMFHAGVAAMEIEDRIELLEEVRPEISAFLLGHHDLAIRGRNRYSLRTREDSVRLAEAHVKLGVIPEFEIFHPGALWNLSHVLERVEVPRPLYLTLFLGWDGGEWSPPTVDEFLHRLRLLPEDAVHSLTVAGDEQLAVQLLAISRGGHVRVGLGDYPYYRGTEAAASTAQLVARIVQLAGEVGRKVATPSEARELLGSGRPDRPATP